MPHSEEDAEHVQEYRRKMGSSQRMVSVRLRCALADRTGRAARAGKGSWLVNSGVTITSYTPYWNCVDCV